MSEKKYNTVTPQDLAALQASAQSIQAAQGAFRQVIASVLEKHGVSAQTHRIHLQTGEIAELPKEPEAPAGAPAPAKKAPLKFPGARKKAGAKG